MGSSFEIIESNQEIKQHNLISKLDNIKSRYILKIIARNTNQKQLLKILKINRKTQKRLDLDINSYIKYSELYSSIEIELIPSKNKSGKFMKKLNKEEELYYHIYFNDSKEETKTNIIKKNENISKIKIIINHQVMSFEDLFSNGKCIESIYIKKCYRNNINNMSGMFFDCSSLKEINIFKLKTNNVENMSYMFDNCSSLKELNLKNFDTSNVKDMSKMFYGCESLEKINLSSFNTKNVIDMSYMFELCNSLKKINISNFTTEKLNEVKGMFAYCKSLQEIQFERFNTSDITILKNKYEKYFIL